MHSGASTGHLHYEAHYFLLQKGLGGVMILGDKMLP
jgi:hypothetical protein